MPLKARMLIIETGQVPSVCNGFCRMEATVNIPTLPDLPRYHDWSCPNALVKAAPRVDPPDAA